MVKYSNSKVYKIIGNVDNSIEYIGSTRKQYLSQRMDTHRSAYKRWKNGKGEFRTSFNVFEKYGIENCSIILLEQCDNIKTKDQLLARERYYMEQSPNCTNKMRPIISDQERLEQVQAYQ